MARDDRDYDREDEREDRERRDWSYTRNNQRQDMGDSDNPRLDRRSEHDQRREQRGPGQWRAPNTDWRGEPGERGLGEDRDRRGQRAVDRFRDEALPDAFGMGERGGRMSGSSTRYNRDWGGDQDMDETYRDYERRNYSRGDYSHYYENRPGFMHEGDEFEGEHEHTRGGEFHYYEDHPRRGMEERDYGYRYQGGRERNTGPVDRGGPMQDRYPERGEGPERGGPQPRGEFGRGLRGRGHEYGERRGYGRGRQPEMGRGGQYDRGQYDRGEMPYYEGGGEERGPRFSTDYPSGFYNQPYRGRAEQAGDPGRAGARAREWRGGGIEGREAGRSEGGYRESTTGWNTPGPYTGRGPKGYRRSDERIREEASERLMQHGQVDASDIEIEVHEGEVTLRGMVNDKRGKRLAEDAVAELSGVRDVHNELRVRGREGQGGEFAGTRYGADRSAADIYGRGDSSRMRDLVSEGMEVIDPEGRTVGKISARHGSEFLLDRTDGIDYLVPYDAIDRIEKRAAVLKVRANQVEAQNWRPGETSARGSGA